MMFTLKFTLSYREAQSSLSGVRTHVPPGAALGGGLAGLGRAAAGTGRALCAADAGGCAAVL